MKFLSLTKLFDREKALQTTKRITRAVVLLGLALLVTSFALLPGVRNDPKFSIFDEATHLDNAWRYAHFDVPQIGEKISPEILSEWTCRGFYDPQISFPDCTDADAVGELSFPFSTSNYNTKHPPLYYASVGFTARIAVALTPIDSFVTAARLSNSIWVLVAFAASWQAGKMLSLRRWQRTALSTTSLTIPVVFGGWFYVNNDVGSYASAWVIAALGIHAWTKGVSAAQRSLILASVMACLTKGFTIGAVIALVIFLLFKRETHSPLSIRKNQSMRAIVFVALSAAATVLGWIIINRTWKSDIPYVSPIVRAPLEGIPWGKISEQIVRFEFPIGVLPAYITSSIEAVNKFTYLWLIAVAWILASMPAVAIFRRQEESSRQMLGLGVASLLGYPAIAAMIVAFNLLDGAPGYVTVIDRYHISAIPFSFLLLAAVSTTSRKAANLVYVVLGVGSAVIFATYLTVVT